MIHAYGGAKDTLPHHSHFVTATYASTLIHDYMLVSCTCILHINLLAQCAGNNVVLRSVRGHDIRTQPV